MVPSNHVAQLLYNRPQTAQPLPLPLPPPFSQTQHKLSSHYPFSLFTQISPSGSIQNRSMTCLNSSASTSPKNYDANLKTKSHDFPLTHLSISETEAQFLRLNPTNSGAFSSCWRQENRLKRTIESMTIGVEKILGKLGKLGKTNMTNKVGLNRPLRQEEPSSSHKKPRSISSTAPSPKKSRKVKQIQQLPMSQVSHIPHFHHGAHASQPSAESTASLSRVSRTYPNREQRVSKRRPSASHSIAPPVSSIHPVYPVIESIDLASRQSTQTAPISISPQSVAFPAMAGAGAKAAVAHHKRSYLNMNQMAISQQLACISDDTQESSDFENNTAQSLADSMDLDSDSFDCEDSETATIDPVKILPSEVIYLVFALLDKDSLDNASQVCSMWHAHANANSVWRDFFFGNFTPSFSGRSSYLQVGGLGLGKHKRVPQPWKQMANARVELEKAWQLANPAATYFCGHTDSVYCCQFDEEKIITGSRDRTIRVWDLKTKKCIKVISSPSYKPTLARSNHPPLPTHQSTIANVESINGTVQGNAIFHVPEYYHHASILCLQFDEEIMVTGSSDSTCIVWDIIKYQPIARLRHHRSGVLDLCFDDEYIVSCSKDHTICIWSRKKYELVNVLSGHVGPVNAVQMRGRKLVSVGGDGNSRLWDLDSFECERIFTSRDRGLAAVEFSDDGKHLLAGGNDQVIYKYDADTAEVVHSFHGHNNLVRSLFIDCNNRRVLSGSYDQSIRVFGFDDGQDIGIFSNWTTSWILSAKCDYRRIVATSQDGRVLLMDFGHNIPGIELLSS